jgi:hypothetical protein
MTLRRQITKFVDEFVAAAAPANDPQERIARSFGLVYAAGRLAKRFDVLPLPKLRRAVLSCYRRAQSTGGAQSTLLTASERVAAYVATNRARLLDLDPPTKYPKMTTAELDGHPGLLKTVGGSLPPRAPITPYGRSGARDAAPFERSEHPGPVARDRRSSGAGEGASGIRQRPSLCLCSGVTRGSR